MWILRVGLALLTCTHLGCGDRSECDHSDQCPPGSYCAEGACQTQCEPGGSDCKNGLCTRHGRCALAKPDPDSGVCGARVLEAEFGIPTLLFLIDQSGSMDEPYSGGTRWQVLRDALMAAGTGVVTLFESSIRFGLTLYTDDRSGTCPDLLVVDPALDNHAAINTVYAANSPDGYTPTGDAIAAVVPDLSAFSEPGPKFIILATDGEPGTCAVPDPQEGQPQAVAATQTAYDEGITLFILSVGTGDISRAHLQDMANAGVGYEVGGTQNAPFYEAGDADQLATAFEEITGRVMTCELEVNGTIEPDVRGVIYLDGDPLTLGANDGWEIVDDTTFRLLGAACDQAQRAGVHTVTAQFGCEAVDESSLHASGGGAVDRGCRAAGSLEISILFGLGLVALMRLRRRGWIRRSLSN